MNSKYMKEALKEANKALLIEEMPVGAVVVYENKIIGRGYNRKESSKDSTMHAEIIAIKRACKKIGDWRLNKCSIYVTMEPCIMCMGAILESRIEKIIYGIENEKSHKVNKSIVGNSKIAVEKGMFDDEMQKLLKNFFISLRNR